MVIAVGFTRKVEGAHRSDDVPEGRHRRLDAPVDGPPSVLPHREPGLALLMDGGYPTVTGRHRRPD